VRDGKEMDDKEIEQRRDKEEGNERMREAACWGLLPLASKFLRIVCLSGWWQKSHRGYNGSGSGTLGLVQNSFLYA
jgi:hypothetical protein